MIRIWTIYITEFPPWNKSWQGYVRKRAS